MSKRTRYFVTTAVAILIGGLATGLVASYFGLPVALSRAAGPDELQYVPADAAVVAYANVRQIMDSSFRERFRRFEPDTRERDEFEAKTGVDIEQDINSVVAAMMPSDGVRSGASRVLVLARGRFEQERLEALALEHGGRVEDYRGKRLLLHNGDGDGDMAIGFIEGDLIALGGREAIQRAIDARTGPNVVSNTELMRQITEFDASNAWAVGRFDAIAGDARMPREIQARMPAIQWFSAATHINGGVSGVFKAEARDEAAAQNMRDIVTGFLALAKLQADSRPELKAVVESLQLSGDGRNVAVSFRLPTELFDALEELKKLEQPRR